ncbi:MAG: sulfatase-like hydrolase/transferase, partial [Planctomycetes bacterium]|nr:sulfatase-like hydrolase/transferase [Planctomycetota bacterium]
NAVCSPTRATYLTGLMPSKHGVHSYLGTGSLSAPSTHYTLSEFRTLPKILGEAGYTCGLAGKWHLGDCLYPQDGFTYWVTKPGGHTSTFYDADVIENGAVRKEPTYLTDFWTRHAVRFIEQNKDRSFFLYLPYNGPYGLGS